MGNQFEKLSRCNCISSAHIHDDRDFSRTRPAHSKRPIPSANNTYDAKDASIALVVPSKPSDPSANTHDVKYLSTTRVVSSKRYIQSAHSYEDKDPSTTRTVHPASSIPSFGTQNDEEHTPPQAVFPKRPLSLASTHEDEDLSRTQHSIPSFNPQEDKSLLTTQVAASKCLLSSPNTYEDKTSPPTWVLPIKLDSNGFHEFRPSFQGVLANIPSEVCTETGGTHVLWSDIQRAFEGVDHLVDKMGCKVLYSVRPDGELYRPLRIKHGKRYEVVHQSTVNTILGRSQSRRTITNMASEEKELSFGRLLEICRGLYKQAKHNIKQDEVSFQQVAINARYYHSLLMDEIQRMDATGVEVQLRGKGRVQILEKIQNYEQQDLDWDYLGTCYNTLVKDTIAYDSPAPRLFIILPADLDAWDDLDPATHTFRLYFLCNTKNEDSPRHHLPKHVHLSDHAGYSLKRPQEFMQAYGNYVLRILEAINRGYSDENIEIPYIGSFKILWKHTPRVGSKFSKDTFRPLVDKSIAYLQKTRRPDLFSDLALSRSECALIKTFLDVQVCDNTTGNLHRHIDHNQYVYWMCQAHAQQGAHSASLAGLESFVRNHRGHIDMQRSTLKVELRSVAEVGQFNSFLARTKHIFSISIKLRWEPTRLHLEHLCYGIVKTNAVSLEIDGLILDNHSQDHVQYLTSVFTNSIVPTSGLQLIVLLNFPRSQQWCIFTGDCALQSTLSTEQLLEFNWMELRSNLSKFRVLLSVAHEVSDCTTSSKELKSALAKHGIEYVNEIRIHDQYWAATCDLEAGIPVAMRLFHSDYDTSLGYMGVLQRLVVDLPDPEFGDELKRIIKANVELDELTVSVPGGDEVDQISGYIARLWENTTEYLDLTLFDRTDDHQPRDFVQLRFNGKNCNWVDPWKGRCVEGCPSRSEHQAQGFPTHISFQKWECDHAPLLRSDNSALVLDMAGRSYPLVLTSFVLDVSSLSSAGLVHVQNILRHSGLNHLTVMGMNFDPSLSESIAQTLQSVQWPTLKSFILFGDQINEWLALWSTHETQLTLTDPSMAPRLLCVHVQGSGSVQHQLSHASILFLHQLIDASPLAELYFQNVLLLDKRDWALVVESIDPLLLETLGLCPGSTRQLQDAGEAWEMFQAKFEMAE